MKLNPDDRRAIVFEEDHSFSVTFSIVRKSHNSLVGECTIRAKSWIEAMNRFNNFFIGIDQLEATIYEIKDRENDNN